MNDPYQKAYEQYKEDYAAKAAPSSDEGKEHIVAVRKNEEGDIIAFRTDGGRDLDYPTALQEAKEGLIAHVDVFERYGREILRSEPDHTEENNFDHLDTF